MFQSIRKLKDGITDCFHHSDSLIHKNTPEGFAKLRNNCNESISWIACTDKTWFKIE